MYFCVTFLEIAAKVICALNCQTSLIMLSSTMKRQSKIKENVASTKSIKGVFVVILAREHSGEDWVTVGEWR